MKNIKKFNNIQHYNKYRHLLYKPSIVLINEKNNYGIQIQYSIKHINVDFDPIIYNGSLQMPTNITVVCNGETLTENIDYVITENNGGVNTGTYIFKVKGIGFYTRSEKTVSYTIGKASGLVNIIPTPISNLVYDGTSKNLIESGSGTGTMEYSLDNSTWSTEIPSVSNAGTYTVYYKADESTNYNESTVGSLQVTISKATPTVTAPTAKVLTYNTTAQELVNLGSTNYGTLKYSLDGASYSTNIPTATNYGSYTVYYKVEGDSNVNDVTASSVQCSINEKQVTATVELSQDIYTYDGSTKEPTVTIKDGSTVIPSSEYTVIYSNNTNAGIATVTITDNAGGNYEVIGSTTFTINKANLSASVSMSGWTYGGTASNPSVSGNSGSGAVTYSYKVSTAADSTYTSTKPSNAGTYTVRAQIAETGNYNSATVTNTFTIAKANLSASVSMSGWTYGGTASNPSVSGNSGSGTVTYSYKVSTAADSTYTSTKPSNAGTYTVRAQIAETSNYNSATITNTFTIAKANQNAPTASGATTTYSSTATATASGGGGQGSLEWESVQSQTSVGSHTTRARWSGNTNYNASPWSNSVTVQMNKADQSAPTATGAVSVYPTAAVATATGGGGKGSIEWNNGNTQTSIGSKSTQARWSGNENYNASSWSNSVTLTVTDAYNGHTYVNLGLPSGTMWATMNIGATSETDYGNYYRYGKGASTFADSTSSYYRGTEDPLKFSNDAARQTWGGSWHMPTKTQLEELLNNTTHTWVTINGINGLKCTSSNGNYIFFPAGNGIIGSNTSANPGSYCYYWTSTPNAVSQAYNLLATTSGASVSTNARQFGFLVRAVIG